MSKNPRTPLTPTAKEALEILEEPISSWEGDGCPRSTAHGLLTEAEFDENRAERAVHQLLMRGYLYEVDDRLFVTPNG